MASLSSHGQVVAACELLADLTVMTVTGKQQTARDGAKDSGQSNGIPGESSLSIKRSV